MGITNTRINEKGEEEIVISDFSSFKELVDEIDRIREEEKTYDKEPIRIFVDQYIISNQKHIYNEISLSNIIFLHGVSLTNIEFHSNIEFYNIEFKSPVFFRESKFLGDDTTFNNIIFNDLVNFIKTSFQNEISFSDILFKKEANFYNASFTNITSMTFSPTFNDKAKFDKAIFEKKNINFNGSIFNNKASFCNCPNLSNVSFINTIFNNRVDFYETNFTTSHQFYLTSFMDRVNFNNVTFEQEIQFLDCKLGVNSFINFQGATFNKGIDISRSNFNLGKVSFWDINLKDEGLLGDTLSSEYYKNDFGNKEILPSVPKKLRESMRFIKNSFYSEGNRIEGSEFEKKELEVYREELYIKLNGTGEKKKSSKISKEEVTSIFGIIIPLQIYISNYENKNLYWIFILLFIFFTSFMVITKATISFKEGIKNIKEIINSNLLVYGLSISIFFGILFCSAYYLYIVSENHNPIIWHILAIAYISPILIFTNLTKDYIILLFNKHSNDFGTNWVNGVVFTLLISMITFVLMATFSDLTFAWHERGVNNVLEGILEIINLFPFKETNEENLFYNMNTGTKIVLFIGRIFIGYGVYQTIQAFRKYGKS